MAFLRSVATVGIFTLLSRFLGFFRDLMIAILLGAGPLADAFVTAQRLPNAFRSIFAEGAMDTAFVPIYTRKRQQELPESVQDFINHIYTILVIVILPLTGIAMLFMPDIVSLISPGFVGDAARFPVAVAYSNITFPYLILISITALQGGLLNANSHFAPGAAAPAILNATMIVGFIGAWALKLDAGFVGSWALIIGGFIQLGVVFFACRHHKLALHFSWPKLTVDVRQFFKLVGPGVLGTGADQLNGLISTMLASSIPGAVAGLYYADRLNQMPIGVIGGAVATALLPALTRHIAAKEEDTTVYYFSRALEITLMFCIPACLILVLAPYPIVRILFQHGVFNAEGTRITAEIISAYALTIPAQILVRMFTIRFFAHENTRAAVIASLCSIVINVILGYAFRQWWQHFGIALAYSVTTCLNAMMLWVMLHRQGYGRLESSTLRKIPLFALSAVLMGVVLVVSSHPADALASHLFSQGLLHEIVAFGLRVTACGITYVGALFATKAMRPEDFRSLLKRA